MDDHEINESFDAKQGVGIKYKYNGEDYISVCEAKRRVKVSVSSYIGISPGAEHYYGRLTVYDLWAKKIDQKENSIHSTPNKPKEMEGFDIEITYISTKTVIKRGLFLDTEMSIKKGDRTTRFDDKKLLIERIMFELNRLFPKNKGWDWDLGDLDELKGECSGAF